MAKFVKREPKRADLEREPPRAAMPQDLEAKGAVPFTPHDAFVARAEAEAKDESHGADPRPDTAPRPREGHGGEHVNLGREEPFSSAARVKARPDDERLL